MWLSEWRAICARISGLHKAAAFTAEMLPDHKRDYASGTAIALIGHANRIGESLMSFLDQFGPALPDQARNSLKHFCLNRQKGKFFADTTARPPATELLPSIALLLSFQAAFEYLVSDSEYLTKTLVGRAFVHLRSSIAADRKVRQSWIEAFNRGEPACERLGASHLLLHGVWSFKASAEHARTDLVLSDPRTDWDEPRRAAQGLVLTEWKRVAAPERPTKRLTRPSSRRNSTARNPSLDLRLPQSATWSSSRRSGFCLCPRHA